MAEGNTKADGTTGQDTESLNANKFMNLNISFSGYLFFKLWLGLLILLWLIVGPQIWHAFGPNEIWIVLLILFISMPLSTAFTLGASWLLFYSVPVLVLRKQYDRTPRKEGLIFLGIGLPMFIAGLTVAVISFMFASLKIGDWQLFLFSPYLLFGGLSLCLQGLSVTIFRSRLLGVLFIMYLILGILFFGGIWTLIHQH